MTRKRAQKGAARRLPVVAGNDVVSGMDERRAAGREPWLKRKELAGGLALDFGKDTEEVPGPDRTDIIVA